MSSSRRGIRKEKLDAIGPARSRNRAAWWGFGLLLFLLLMAGIAYSADLLMNQGKVPRGVTVGGVAIGGMDETAAKKALQDDLGDKVRQPFRVHAGEADSTIDPTLSGLRVNWDQTVANAGQQPKNPWTRLESFWKTREVGIVTDIDQSSLNNSLQRVGRELTRNPTNAALAIGDDGKAKITPPVKGQNVDGERLSSEVTQHWLNTNGVVSVPATTINPEIGQDALDRAQRDVVNKVVSGPVTFNGRDNAKAVIQPGQMGQIVTFRPDGYHFAVDYSSDAAKRLIQAQLAQTEKTQKDAQISISPDGKVSVTSPSVDGVAIDWSKTLDGLEQKLTNTTVRDYDVAYKDQPAVFTTDMAQKADFSQVMGEFTTGGFSDASGVNIRRVAQMVDGAIVAPGQTFSLNGYTGPRGAAQGFVESGIILNGHADKAVGGGISQFATTLYNASYFAGMDDVAHTPHSYYISRYPAGREATVYEGAIDLKFKNPFDEPVMIKTSADDSSVTVQIKGIPKVKVQSIQGAKTNYTDPQVMNLSGSTCSPSSGSPGFTVTDTRVVTSLATGQEISRKTTTTKYDPSPIVRCS